MTIIEKIIAAHCGREQVFPGEIADVSIDIRLARDFGGAGVVKNLAENGLQVADPGKTWFTFDCNPGGSDQEYAANQQRCRVYARNNSIGLYDINAGIGTHLVIDKGLALPGNTVVSTDSHANILGAIGCFGQGMGDRDIAAAWSSGSVWFKVPETVRIVLQGQRPEGITAKDIALNLLSRFGADSLLGYAVEVTGEMAGRLTLDERITISSMATEMGAIILFFTPGEEIITFCYNRSGEEFSPVFADDDARYAKEFILDATSFYPALSLPGKPHRVVPAEQVTGTVIDSVFIGSCTNGRMEDMRAAASILKGKKTAPGVVLKIVPATDDIWNECLSEGLLAIFKESGALVGNAGCAGCASGQIGQNGPGEVTVSTGNRNFTGKQGKGDVYLASPAIAAASAVAGYITIPGQVPVKPSLPRQQPDGPPPVAPGMNASYAKPVVLTGRIWLIPENNIDTDMIFHNRHLAITDMAAMGRFAFGNLKGWEDFPARVQPGDIVVTGRNFGAGSSRQQAVDCFRALGIQAIVARSFGAIYERNAINAGFPVLTSSQLNDLELQQNDVIMIDLEKQWMKNTANGKEIRLDPVSEVQLNIYQAGDILRLKAAQKP